MRWHARRALVAAVIALSLMLAEIAAAEGSGARAAASCTGTVVDLSCDTVTPPGGTVRCDPGEHYFALKVAGDPGLRPLVVEGGSPRADALRSGALTGREVRVVGSCTPRGAIAVEDVVPLG